MYTFLWFHVFSALPLGAGGELFSLIVVLPEDRFIAFL